MTLSITILLLTVAWSDACMASPMASTSPVDPDIRSPILGPAVACEMPTWTYQEHASRANQERRQSHAAMKRVLREERDMASILRRLDALDYVDPQLLSALNGVYAQMRARGYTVMPVETFRSPERQARLLATGNGITTVGAMRSCHQYGLAVDSVVFRDGVPQYNMRDPWVMRGYQLFGELVMARGLEWGGSWSNPRDYGHVEKRIECQAAIRSAPQYFASLNMRVAMARFR
ncbi:MAG: M15 family metallopeptidase [Luteimonas sp.]